MLGIIIVLNGGRSNNDSSSPINTEISTQTFYRFFNRDIDASLQTWKKIPEEAQPPSGVSWVSAVQFKPNSLSCYLFGKSINKPANTEVTLVYKLDSLSGNISYIKTIPVDISRQQQTVPHISGKIYVFADLDNELYGPDKYTSYYVVYLLDTIGYEWKLKRQIFYIGGREFQDGDVNIYEIRIYDTNAGEWTSMVSCNKRCTSNTRIFNLFANNITIHKEISSTLKIDRRHGHTAVLTPDGNIVIYGGGKGELHTTAYPQLFVLKKYRKSYKWVAPTEILQILEDGQNQPTKTCIYWI
ncbi:11497_t:CDS:2 [Racocetra fulgida]|uniref:11497_t:CDS:1 n=1 Tax=Racocetra fulgida TaxID=60492 RepID=A0A9N9A947_9GLOM|nr:11497_t:CDS:2 [Racocetra fulgida]